MKPGRELDMEIANRIFRLEYVHPDGTPPRYSTDIADAWQVVQNFQARKHYKGFWVSDQYGDYCCPEDGSGPWYAATCLGRGVKASSGETAAHAICLAALETVEESQRS